MVYMEVSSYSGTIQRELQVGLRPDLEEGRFLLCDDIYDSGRTVRAIHEMYPHVSFDTICLVSKVPEAPVIYGMEVPGDCWVDFFWEIM